jgi:hypothetical protein|nr:MAG TPA: hypothetical protein [Caudoviricetes sp.]
MKIYNSPTSYGYNLNIIKALLKVAKEEYCSIEDEEYYEESDIDGIPDLDDIMDIVKDELMGLWSKDVTPPFTDQDSGNITIIDKNNRLKYEASIVYNENTHRTMIMVTVSTFLPVLVNNCSEIILQTEYRLDGIYRRKRYECKSKFDT